jgi:hypothetical protein
MGHESNGLRNRHLQSLTQMLRDEVHAHHARIPRHVDPAIEGAMRACVGHDVLIRGGNDPLIRRSADLLIR